MNEQSHPLIGTVVWVRKGNTVLLARRAKEKERGAGEWCPPGGHLEMFETIENCAVRETHEESGVEIDGVRLVTIIEGMESEQESHYVTFYYVADWVSGEPRPQEGESEDWQWFAWDALPQPLFKPLRLFLEKGINPLEF